MDLALDTNEAEAEIAGDRKRSRSEKRRNQKRVEKRLRYNHDKGLTERRFGASWIDDINVGRECAPT